MLAGKLQSILILHCVQKYLLLSVLSLLSIKQQAQQSKWDVISFVAKHYIPAEFSSGNRLTMPSSLYKNLPLVFILPRKLGQNDLTR